MGKIIVLDELTSCQIAAGEVIERPASVVKETVENSIDAGATRISVEIKNGGISLIKIEDNGCGMEADDCVIAFDKHATSKLRSANDLFDIHTLGFRGEALASIAAVAKVTLRTATETAPHGTEVVFEGGDLLSNKPCGCGKGTSITVENLFYNTPARYKFLKKDSTEAGYVADTLEKIALAHPDISIRLISDRKQVLYTPGGDLKKAFFSIFGGDVAANMLDCGFSMSGITVTGLCGTREQVFGNRGRQFVFVNGRFIRSKTITSAIDEAYKTLTMKGKFPTVVINVSVPQTAVDVNVHPAKTEVRFADESAVFRAVYHAIFGALFGYGDVSEGNISGESIHAENIHAENISTGNISKSNISPGNISAENIHAENISTEIQPERTDVRPAEEVTFFELPEFDNAARKPSAEASEKPSQTAYEAALSVQTAAPGKVSEEKPSEYIINKKNPENRENPKDRQARNLTENELVYRDGRVIGQLLDTYILIEYDGALYLLDQHAAHERLKYEELKEALENTENDSQQLMLPITLTLTGTEFQKFRETEDLFENLGFEIDEFGVNIIIIRAIPTFISQEKVQEFIITALESAVPGEAHINVFPDYAVYTMACKAAIKANRHLSDYEIRGLLDSLLAVKNPGTCPHGRPIIIKMTQYEIERKFHRA